MAWRTFTAAVAGLAVSLAWLGGFGVVQPAFHKLNELKEKGALSSAEFEQAKAKLLA